MPDHRILYSMAELDEYIPNLASASTIAIDLETSGFDWMNGYVVGIALSHAPEQAVYVPISHPDISLSSEDVLARLKPVLEDPSKTYVFHNAKFDVRFFRMFGVNIPIECVEDTMLEVFCAGELHSGLGLKPLVSELYGYTMVGFDELFPSNSKHLVKNVGKLLCEIVGLYACDDVDYTHRLHTLYFDRIRTSNIYKMERRLWPVVSKIEEVGFNIDTDYCKVFSAYLRKALAETENTIYEQVYQQAGYPVNFSLSSDHQLAGLLYDTLDMPVTKKTDKGKPSTDAATLKKLSKMGYSLVDNILAYKGLEKAIESFDKTLPNNIWSDYRIHTSYHQAGAWTTGRFSSSDPNMQNISKPKSWKLHKSDGSDKVFEMNARRAFIPDDGHYLVELDYGQIEFVLMAYLAGEHTLLRAYANGLDIHQTTASLVHVIPYEEVTKQQRDAAKMFNYLIIYGGTAYGLAQRSDLTEAQAEVGIKAVFDRYPRFKAYMDDVKSVSRQTKSVTTFFGRKSVIREFYSKDAQKLSRTERVGVNYIMQGTAADVQKFGLIFADMFLAEAVSRGSVPNFVDESQVRLVAQTHDSQTYSIHKSIRPQDILPPLMDAMSPDFERLGYNLKGVPFPRIRVDAELGLNWGDMTPYDPSTEYDWGSENPIPKRVKVEDDEPTDKVLWVDLSVASDIGKAVTDINSLVTVYAASDAQYALKISAGDGREVDMVTSMNHTDFVTVLKSVVPQARVQYI